MIRTLLALVLTTLLAAPGTPALAQTAQDSGTTAQGTAAPAPAMAAPAADTRGSPDFGTAGGTYREQPTGMARWLAMPFPLVLWLLLSPLVFAVATTGPPSHSSSVGRPVDYPDGRPVTTVS